MRFAAASLLLVALLGDAGLLASPRAHQSAATPEPLVSTREGPVLRVGPSGSAHFVGLLANGEGAVGLAVTADRAFLAFTCGMAARADAWFSGDWYRGHLVPGQPVTLTGPDGEQLTLAGTVEDGIRVEVVAPDRAPVSAVAARAAPADGLFRREDADGVLGAVALPGNAVCAVKRTNDGRFLPAGTVPY